MSNYSRFIVLFVLFPVILSLTACSDSSNPVDPDVARLSGPWLWIRSSGGFFPRVITPTEGTSIKDFFTINSEFSRRRNDTLVMTARYVLSKVNGNLLLKYTDVQKYAVYPTELFDEWVHIEGDTLQLQDNGSDLFLHTYIRLR